MFKWFKPYLKQTSLFVLLPLNIILAMLSSGAFVIALISIFGFMNSESTTEEKIYGVLIILAIPIAFYVINFICYKILKRLSEKTSVNAMNHNRKLPIILLILLMIFLLVVFSIVLPYPFNNIWLWFNSWWF